MWPFGPSKKARQIEELRATVRDAIDDTAIAHDKLTQRTQQLVDVMALYRYSLLETRKKLGISSDLPHPRQVGIEFMISALRSCSQHTDSAVKRFVDSMTHDSIIIKMNTEENKVHVYTPDGAVHHIERTNGN